MNDKYVAKYLRISDDDDDVGEQKSESDSIANQRKVLEDYIGSHGELSQYVVKEFADAPDIIGLKQNPTKRASL